LWTGRGSVSSGDFERFGFVKTSRIIWLVLLMVAGFTCWFSRLTIPQPAAQARIKVENDVTDIPGMKGTPTVLSFDPYFIQENRCDCRDIFIAAGKVK